MYIIWKAGKILGQKVVFDPMTYPLFSVQATDTPLSNHFNFRMLILAFEQ